MREGVILIDKEQGMTSFDVVAKIRRLFGTKQVGHTGTLDPMATGLLPVMVGRAVKASEFLSSFDKEYIATLKLGITTDTEDITGKILSKSEDIPDFDTVKNAVMSFKGRITQIPPMYSALKVDGQKLCDLARKGVTVEREGRDVFIYDISVFKTEENDEYSINVSCSKGTYIRTLCADIGQALGCGGVMSSLRRTKTGGFDIKDAHTLSELENMSEDERISLLLDTESLFYDLPKASLPPFFAHLADCGCQIYQKKIGTSFPLGQRVRMYDERGFFSIGEVREYPEGNAIKPIKKFRLE